MDAIPLRGISSMATRSVLEALARGYRGQGNQDARFESVGGVDAARRVAAGENFDVIVLAADALARLADAGHVVADSLTPIVRSVTALAVPAGAPRPPIDTEACLRAAVLDAPSIGYSTGPSGTALLALFERWGVGAMLHDRLVMAPPGVPVARLVAERQVALGFQQRCELLGMPGVDLVGDLPAPVGIVTTFSAACGARSARGSEVAALLRHLASPEVAAIKQQHGLEPA